MAVHPVTEARSAAKPGYDEATARQPRTVDSPSQALAAMADGDTLRTLLAALRRIMKVMPVNTVVLRRRVADAVIDRKGYPF